jgi:hypothetical protein
VVRVSIPLARVSSLHLGAFPQDGALSTPIMSPPLEVNRAFPSSESLDPFFAFLCRAENPPRQLPSLRPTVSPSPPFRPEVLLFKKWKLLFKDSTFIFEGSFQEGILNAINRLSGSVLYSVPDSVLHIQSLFRSFQEQFSIDLAIAEVATRPHDFSVFDLDASILNQSFGGDFFAFVRSRQLLASQDGFNHTRCRDVFANHPNFLLLMEIAQIGASVFRSDSFLPASAWDEVLFRKRQIQLQDVYSFKAWELYNQGKCIILPFQAIPLSLIPSIHISAVHHTTKEGDPLGRFCIDPSNPAFSDGSGWEHSVLNTPESREFYMNHYGPLVVPQIQDIIVSWVDFVHHTSLSWQDVVIFKEDVAKAHETFQVRTSDVPLLAVCFQPGYLMFHFNGCFGWNAASFVFNTIAQALIDSIRLFFAFSIFHVVMTIYVDDIIGLCPLQHSRSVTSSVQDFIVRVFGRKGWNEKKSFIGPSCDTVLGFRIDLRSQTISLNSKNINTLLMVLFCFDTSKHVHIHFLEMLSSLINRARLVCRASSPFCLGITSVVRRIYRQGVIDRRQSVLLDSFGVFCVEMWRVMILHLYLDPFSFRVSLYSLLPTSSLSWSFLLVSDASPQGLSFFCYDSSGLIAFASLNLSWSSAEDVKHQNVREYCGTLLAFLLLKYLRPQGIRNSVCRVIGDSCSSLAWLRENKICSSPCIFAFMLMHRFLLSQNICVQDPVRIKSKEMGDVDAASRNLALSVYQRVPDKRLVWAEHVAFKSFLDKVLAFADPSFKDLSLADFHQINESISSLLSSWDS